MFFVLFVQMYIYYKHKSKCGLVITIKKCFNFMTVNTKKLLSNMSQLKFILPVQLGNYLVNTRVSECYDGYETFYEVAVPAIGADKKYYLRIVPDGSVKFYFDRHTPEDLRKCEQAFSAAIFDYYYFEGLTKDYVL